MRIPRLFFLYKHCVRLDWDSKTQRCDLHIATIGGENFSSFLEKYKNVYFLISVNKSSRTSRRQVSWNIICRRFWCPRPSCPDSTRANLNCITRYSTLACCPTIFPLQSSRFLNFCQSWWLVVSPQWKTNPLRLNPQRFCRLQWINCGGFPY